MLQETDIAKIDLENLIDKKVEVLTDGGLYHGKLIKILLSNYNPCMFILDDDNDTPLFINFRYVKNIMEKPEK